MYVYFAEMHENIHTVFTPSISGNEVISEARSVTKCWLYRWGGWRQSISVVRVRCTDTIIIHSLYLSGPSLGLYVWAIIEAECDSLRRSVETTMLLSVKCLRCCWFIVSVGDASKVGCSFDRQLETFVDVPGVPDGVLDCAYVMPQTSLNELSLQ